MHHVLLIASQYSGTHSHPNYIEYCTYHVHVLLCNSYMYIMDVWHLLHRSMRAHRARGLRSINAMHPEGM